MTNRKAIVKGTIKISFIVAVLVALGFLVVNYALPALAAHSSTAAVSPGVVQASTAYAFTVTISNDGGSSDPISEVRIYHDSVELSNPNDFTGYTCDSKGGWNGPFVIEGSEGTYCLYTAKTADDRIAPGESTDFTFSATSPETESCRNLHFESRDPQQFWLPLYDDVCVDKDPPVTTKEFTGPKKVDGNGVEWIDGVTQIVLNPIDPEPHPSGVDKTWYINTLTKDDACRYPDIYCQPSDVEYPAECINGGQDFCDENWQSDWDSWESCVGSWASNNCQWNWNLYTGPFQKDEESCHQLQFFSVDNIGNVEDMNTNCFFVDKTPPVLDKEVGQPSVDETNEEEVGNGWVMWTTSDYYSSPSAAKLYVLDGTQDWAGVDVPVDIALEDINSLSFWELIESYNPNGWSVNVILGVDADADGVFESDLDGWHIGPDSWTLEALNGDTFVEMDGATGNPTTNVWTNTDAYNTPQWWTPDESGAGFAKSDTYPWTFYDTFDKLINVFIPDSTQTSLIPDTNARVKLIKLVIGGSGSWNDETAIVDDLSLNGNVILSEITSDRFSLVSPVTPITFSCNDPEPHPSDDEELCFKVSYDKDPFDLTSLYAAKYQTSVGQDGFACVPVGGDLGPLCGGDGCPDNNFVFNFNEEEDSVHDLEYYCKDAVEKKSETFLQWYKVDTESPVITKKMFGSWLGDCPPTEEGDVCYVADDGSSGVSISVQDIGHAAELGAECRYELWWEDQPIQSGYFNDYQEITFYQDSTHTLKIWCQDALDNPVYDEEEFLVDSTPPETEKTYGDPTKIEGDYRWIKSSTPIGLTPVDRKVGTDKLYWRNTLLEIPDQACIEECNYEGLGVWNIEDIEEGDTVTIYKPEESCHLIEYYSVDLLGNTEGVKKQCVFVDNTPPIGLKEVGEPKIPCDGNNNGDNGGNNNNGGQNSPGDYIATVNFDTPCPSGVGVGIAYDGENLWYSCGWSGLDLYRADPLTGVVDASYDIVSGSEGLGALAYDASRNAIWAGWDDASGEVRLIQLDGSKDVVGTTSEFFAPEAVYLSLDDGLAYDASDDTLYISGDVSPTIQRYETDGTYLGGFAKAPGSSCGNSGLALGGDLLYQGFDGCNQVIVVDKSDTSTPVFSFSTIVGPDPGFRDEDLECDTNTFDVHVMWSVEAYEPRRALAFEVPANTCGIGGLPSLCGNGIVEPPEECDDGNNVNGDGCSVTCKVEVEDKCDWYVRDQETEVTLDCNDPKPHPVDQETVCYRVSYDLDPDGYITDEYCSEFGGDYNSITGECCAYVGDGAYTFNFPEESLHDLEYYCKDYLGNANEPDLEYFKVDSTPPVIEKTVVGPQIDCIEYEGELDCIQIDGVTEIQVDAIDPEPHPVNDVTCDWRYFVVENESASGGAQGVIPPFVIQFPEESTHVLDIVCSDALGNTAYDLNEVFIVDKTPPVTRKIYEGPFYENENAEWITSDTNVILEATDAIGPHDSGVKTKYWRNTLVDDTYCNGINIIEDDNEANDDLLDCDDAVGSGDWNLYTESFNKKEESCHLIEYYSVDNVEKTETVKKQCVFVDNTPPTPDKKVGEPKAVWDGKDANFYPEIGDLCWNGQENEIECWKTTLLTPIKLDCTDPDPHPVNNEKSCFKVEWDGDDQTETYCDNFEGDLTEDGFCCVSEEITFMFNKISEHELEYYCEDALGNSNKENLDIEKFKVEETKFEIQINKKWNLISTPVVLLDDSMKVIFGEESDTIEAVWAYDGETDQWYVYTPDGEDNDNLDTMIPGWGYWVKAWKDDMLVIGGSLMSPGKTPPSKTIVSGWNLVGYYGAEGQEGYDGPDGNGDQANCVFNSLGEDVWDKEFTSLWTYWEPDNPNQWIPYDQWGNMDPGAGYWLATPQNGLYTPSTTCGWD